MKLALAFQHRTPTIEQLMHEFDMSRATAYRWRAAFIAAKCEVPA